MEHNDLSERWSKKLKAYIHEEFGAHRDRLSASDFQFNLKINFEDSSFAFFHYAFYLLDRELNEVAVFTEHCGYHIFPLEGTQIELLESKWSDA